MGHTPCVTPDISRAEEFLKLNLEQAHFCAKIPCSCWGFIVFGIRALNHACTSVTLGFPVLAKFGFRRDEEHIPQIKTAATIAKITAKPLPRLL